MDEAKRQATNPDDFALRLAGISGTSDSKWDDFDVTAAAREAAIKAQQGKPRPQPTPAEAVPAPGQGLPRAKPTSPAPQAAAPQSARPASGAASPAQGDDFTIERF
jgi:twitching motility protein PilT